MKNDVLYLRKAEMSDAVLLFEWANEAEVRKSAFHTEPILYEEHMDWFRRILADPNEAQYILALGERPIGQIRLSINGDEAEIDYSISKEARGNGYGVEIIKLIKQRVEAEYPDIKKLIGKVKPANAASINCFIKNAFAEEYRQLEYIVADQE